MGNTPPGSLGAAPSCEQSLFRCDAIGDRNVPAFSFKGPGPASGPATTDGESQASQDADAGRCLQYCVPVQNSMAILRTLHAKTGYCCAKGFNDFQGNIHEMIPGMSDIQIWEYDKGESGF
mmetsp:Transcript_1686/g.5513  ORF Transcript_1686/g.5513 Transcript_1686/m.5513 type:complete len:121 (-) Transcript_1686:740-1102(-)